MSEEKRKKKEKESRSLVPAAWVLPYSLEAERGVLGSMILDPRDAANHALENLTEDSFYDPRNMSIFIAVRDLCSENKPVDVLLIQQKLDDQKQLDAVGGPPYLAQLLAEVPSPKNIVSYTEIVRGKYLLREVIHSCARIVQSVNDSPENPQDSLDTAEKEFFRITKDVQSKDTKTAKDMAVKVIALIDKMCQEKGQITGVATGFVDFDQLTSGLQKTDMVVFAARPGVGKTSFALNVMENAALTVGKSVAFFSLEMSAEQLMLRLIASRARVSLKKIRDGIINDTEFDRISNASSEIMHSKMFFDETPSITMPQFRTKSRRLKKAHNIDLIIVDYLQLMKTGVSRPNDNRQSEVAEISGGIKAIAKELEVPVVVLCQLNREADKRDSGKPRLSDLRESGAIEQDADIVGLLSRPEMSPGKKDDKEDDDGSMDGCAFLDIEKHRNGPTGRITLTFLKELTRFENRAFGHGRADQE